jgi:molybdate transport system substrate-binding protein
MVFAAASLSDAFVDMGRALEATDPGLEVRFNFAGSSTLREQLLNGAPADVFAPADPANMEALREGGLVEQPAAFARNQMVIAVPAGNPAGVDGLADLAAESLLIGLCAPTVPCGQLAGRVLERAGVIAAVDTEEPDVRALLAKIGAGELDAGIVYATDVQSAAGAVEGIPIPAAHNVATTYPIAVMMGAANREGAAAFLSLVLSEPGQAIMSRYGFQAP